MFDIGVVNLAAGFIVAVLSPIAGCGFVCIGASFILDHFMNKTKYDELFENRKLGFDETFPRLIKREKTKTGEKYYFSLPPGLSTGDIEKYKLALEQHSNRDIEISYEPYCFILEESYHVKEDKIIDYQYIPCTGKVHFAIGYDKKDKLITCNLSAGNDNTHMLIAGSTGGGKSTCVKSIITSLIMGQKCDLYLYDLKGTELNIFNNINRVKSFSDNVDEVSSQLNNIVEEMKSRYTTFSEAKTSDISEYNKEFPRKKYNHMVVVVDEFSILSDNKEAIQTLERISALGRAAGISLILTTQRPDVAVISPRIKCNCNVVLGLKTSNQSNSRVIMDDGSLSELQGAGNAIFRYGGKDTKIKTMLIKNHQIRELISKYYKKEVKPSQVIIENVNIFDDI